MAKKRIKVSAAYKDFNKKIKALRSFDNSNQENFNSRTLSKKQLNSLTEFVFFNAFREYETFIRDVFLLYTQEKRNSNNEKVVSYLNPKDFSHAEDLIKSSMKVIDWNNPEEIIKRSELYLKNGFPVKIPYTSNKAKLNEYRKLRNHVAHDSTMSLEGYKKVLRNYHGVIPMRIPTVGEYLRFSSKINRNNYNLLDFFDLIEDMANNLA